MTAQHAKKIGVLQSGAFGRDNYHLWRCSACRRYFAAEKPELTFHVVGLVMWTEPYPENRKLNKTRAAWARAIEKGQVCTCEFHADWRTLDDLHVRLPESRSEDPRHQHVDGGWFAE